MKATGMPNGKQPLVSVVMSVFNGQKYVSLAIESVLAQSFSAFEFIIIDDGSRDRTAEIVKGYERCDRRIRFCQSRQNHGLTRSLNWGLSLASGEFIARQDADDLSEPGRLEREVAFLKTNAQVGLVGTFHTVIDSRGKPLFDVQLAVSNADLQVALPRGNMFTHGSVMFRAACTERVGGYRKEMKYVEDFDLWLRISEAFEVANIPQYLYRWRLSPDCISVAKKEEQDAFVRLAIEMAAQRRAGQPEDLRTALKRHSLNSDLNSRRGRPRQERAANLRNWSWILYRNGCFTEAVRFAFVAFLNSPTSRGNARLLAASLRRLLFPGAMRENSGRHRSRSL